MANSIEVKIGADTKSFIDGLKKADRQINATQRTANALEKSLDLEFDSKRAIAAQREFQKALDLTEKKAQEIRDQLKALEDSGRINTIDYQTLQTELAKSDAQALRLKKGLDEVTKSLENAKNVKIEELSEKFKDVGNAIDGAGKKLAPFSAAAAGVVAAAGAIAKKASDLGGDIDEMSERFEISSDTIQRWSYLSTQSGVETNTFSRALIRMRAAMADISTGTSNKATDILSQLGVDPTKYKSQEAMFDGIIQALRQVEDSALQTAYANEIFGDRIANDMLPYIKISEETLAQYNAEFDAMPTLTAAQVKELDHLNDSFTRFNTSIQYASAQLGVALAPIMERVLVLIEEKLVPALERLAEWFGNLSPGTQDAILGLLGVIAVAAPLLILIGKISTGIGGLITLFAKMNKQALVTAAGVAALGAALMLGLNLINDWKKMSTVEKILKSLAVAALVAAAAVTVFHASWSLGIAIGAIVAGVVAGIAAIKAASEDIGVDAGIGDGGVESIPINEYSMTEQDLADASSWTASSGQAHAPQGQINNSHIENTSNDVFYITIEQNEYDAENIADVISRRIATLKQARG